MFDLDHAAIALPDVSDTLHALVGDLGGTLLGGGETNGFRALQVRLGTPATYSGDDHRSEMLDPGRGMTIELLEPWRTDRFDFLERFLEHSGPGAHHLTFKVQGIRDGVDRFRAAGYEPVSTRTDDPWWREAFFHPKDTFGTVIQIADSRFDPSLATTDRPEQEGEWTGRDWWPPPPDATHHHVVLRRVVLGVVELGPARAFFDEVLTGRPVLDEEGRSELAWPGGGRVRLEERPGRPRIERFECDGLEGERVIGGVRFVPENSQGAVGR